MPLLQRLSEGLARKTSRRGLFGRGAEVATGALLGVAAGTLTQANPVSALGSTVCAFPGPPCACEHCQAGGMCAKPCVIVTFWYANGCWVSPAKVSGDPDVTCCDCACSGPGSTSWCGCGSDYHNNPDFCPDGNASG